MGLDGVEIILSVEEEFGISLSDAEAESICTPRDLIEIVCQKLNVEEDLDSDFENEELSLTHYISQRAFYKVRTELIETIAVKRSNVQLHTRIEDLFPKYKGAGQWKLFVRSLGIWGRSIPWHGSWWSGHIAPRTVKDVVEELVEQNPSYLSAYGKWSRSRVRELIRQIISEQLRVYDFDDDSEFVRDLGMD